MSIDPHIDTFKVDSEANFGGKSEKNLHDKSKNVFYDSATLKTFFENNITAFERIQEVLLLKRPVVFVILLLCMNLLLYIIKRLNLNLYSSVALILFLIKIYESHLKIFWSEVIKLAFSSNVDKGGPDDVDRIRTPKEVADIMVQITRPISVVVMSFHRISTDKTSTGKAIWCFALLLAFLVSNILPIHYIVVILVNYIMLLPLVTCNKHVWRLLRNRME